MEQLETRHRRRESQAGRSSRLVVLVAATLLVLSTVVVVAPVPVGGQTPTALPGCTNPPPPGYTNFGPQALRERYGIQPLLDAGFDGQGQTAVLLEFGQSVDLGALDQWMSCLGVTGPPITQKGVLGAAVPIPPSPCGGPSEPACFGEAQGDVYSIIAGAPGLDQLYILVSNESEQVVLPDIVDRLRSGALTDGRRPDVVSLSFGDCMSGWTEAEIAATEQSLQALAEAGTWFFKAAGDSGPSDCSPHPACDPSLAGPDMGYPAASPWVISVGGTEVLDATPQDPNGEPHVWNDHAFNPAICAAGAGGLSSFPRPTFQDVVPGGRVPARRGLPDVSALAGTPGYLNLTSSGEWFGNGGTSLASPLYAAAFASIRSRLLHEGLTPPVLLNDALYAIAADPLLYKAAFRDVLRKDNRIYDTVDCCDARVGYDLASGLGEVRIDVVAELLVAAAQETSATTVPTTPPPTTPASVIPRYTG